MRNAMICASVMLAVFLAWPFLFGGKPPAYEIAPATAARAVIAPAEAKTAKLQPVSAAASAQRPESCYKRFQRAVRVCSGSAGAACRLQAADHWDLCEATGFWPN